MTSTELKQMLEAISGNMHSLNAFLQPQTARNLSCILNFLNSNLVLNVLLPLARISNPSLTMTELTDAINNAQQLIASLQTMVANGDTNKIASWCNNLKNRKLLLDVASWVI